MSWRQDIWISHPIVDPDQQYPQSRKSNVGRGGANFHVGMKIEVRGS